MKKYLGILCVLCIWAAGTAKGISERVLLEGAVSVQAKEPDREESKEEEKTEFSEVFQIQAEGIDYLSVEGIRVPQGSVLAMIGKDSKSSFWKKVREGAEQAVADLNTALDYTGDARLKLIYDAPEKEDVAEQIDIIDQMLDKNPDVLSIGFADVNSGRTQMEMAEANGIPVLAVDSGVENALIRNSSKTDNYKAGAEAARRLCESVGKAGKVALLVHNSQTESGIEREKGFVEELERHYPGMELVHVAYREQDERSVDEIVAAVLMEHPDLNAYFGTNETVTKELVDALAMQEEKAMGVWAAGFDASARLIEAVEKGRLAGIMAQNPYGMGYAAAVSAFRTIAGMENAAEINTGYHWISVENLEEEKSQMLIYK